MTDLKQAQTQFVELMADLFQLDEAQALDFGIYRVIRHRNNAVRAFLGEVQAKGDHKTLVGGKLQKILDATFSSKDAEQSAQIEDRLRELEADLGLSRHLTDLQREEALADAYKRPKLRGDVDEYRSLQQQRDASQHGDDDRLEVLNRLYQFFDRHYQDGDFIVQRRYGREGQRYIRSTGQDTEFRWATEDMYYIKSGDIFTDFPVRLANGAQIVFAVDADTLNATRAALKPNDKVHYQLKSARKEGDAVRVLLEYAKGARTKAHDKAIVDAIVAKTGAQAEDAARWLRRYIARNQSDFFIHKRLGEALNEELDIFLKTDVLDADQLLAGHARAQRHTRVAQQVRAIGREIIAFLAALEDFQKQLWEKKKLVLETRYIVTLDRIEKLAGKEWLEERLPAIIKAQRKEWKALGLGDYGKPKDCRGDSAYLPLPVDTGNVDPQFKWDLLGEIAKISDALDGELIHGENWQLLHTAGEAWRGKVGCTYIDPPYNAAGTSEIPYKNAYKHSSWLALMQDRLSATRDLMTPRGVIEIAIDENEASNLEQMLCATFPSNDVVGVSVQHNRRGIQGDNFSYSSEWMYVTHPRGKGVLREIPREEDEYTKDNFRNWGDESDRTDAKNCFYPVIVSADGEIVDFGDVADDDYHPKARTVKVRGKSCFEVWPIDNDGNEKKWRYARDTVEGIRSLLSAESVGSPDFEIKKLKVSDKPKTLWDKKAYHAGDYGTKVLTAMFGREIKKVFQFPKSVNLVMDAVQVASSDDSFVIDYFGGSGTTAHAVMALNQTGRGHRKFAVCEVNHYFEKVIVPRVKKSAANADWRVWKDGKAAELTGVGCAVRVTKFEQYEDTLENLALTPEQGESATLPFDDGPTALRWKLDEEAHRVYCAIEHYRSPFGYTLRRAEGAGSAEKVAVDLVESLVWLLGLDVARMWRGAQGVGITGKNRRGETVLVAFRECDAKGSGDWVMRLMSEHPADRVYTNDPADLAFPGADKLEAIEAVFARQFGTA